MIKEIFKLVYSDFHIRFRHCCFNRAEHPELPVFLIKSQYLVCSFTSQLNCSQLIKLLLLSKKTKSIIFTFNHIADAFTQSDIKM